MKGHWSRVYLVKREVLLEDLHATNVLPFPNANEKKSVLQSLYLCESNENPLKSRKKSMSIFPSHWKIFATVFLCFIAGEYHASINIHK